VAGTGINVAQRIMDCGDAGHILMSKRVAEDLEQYANWQPYLHELGEIEVKHGVRVHIVNLYTEELGNPEMPDRFKAASATAAGPATKRSSSQKYFIVAGAIIAAVVLSALIFRVAGTHLQIARRISGQDGGHFSGPSVTVPEKSIAVLPFE